MSKFVWDDSLSLGIKEIDEQHKNLLELADKFHSIKIKDIERDEILDAFNNIISYAHTHFQTEEKYFSKFDYPLKEEHIKKHQDLLREVNEIFMSFNENNLEKSGNEIADLLVKWIEEHLKLEDRKFAKFYFKKQ